MQVKLKQIFINDKRKDGTPYVNKNLENFQMVTIVSESGKKASMYVGPGDIGKLAVVKNWKPGEIVSVDITMGEKYNNFDIPRPQVMQAVKAEVASPMTNADFMREQASDAQEQHQDIDVNSIPF